MGCCVSRETTIGGDDKRPSNTSPPPRDSSGGATVLVQNQQMKRMILLHAVVPLVSDIAVAPVELNCSDIVGSDSVAQRGRVDQDDGHLSAVAASSLVGVIAWPSGGSVFAGSNADYPASQIRNSAWSPNFWRDADRDSEDLHNPDRSLVQVLSVDSGT